MDAEGTPVELYVYDLSQGMARMMSRQLTGRQIDGIWHTSVVVYGMEYYYGGGAGFGLTGVSESMPGRTHHGTPLQRISMGKTQIPREMFLEYLEEIKQHWRADKYHLLDNNCNHFSNEVCNFLVGQDIPPHITSLPREFVDTPFGRQILPLLENMFGPSQIARSTNAAASAASAAAQAAGPLSSSISNLIGAVAAATQSTMPSNHQVQTVYNLSQLHSILASHRCVVVDFTSPMCPPCTAISPEFERLLSQYNHEFRQEGMGEASRRDMCKIVGVKVDITVAREIAQHYGITATPTFVFYQDGNKFHEFRGANRTELRSGMELLLNAAFPPHPHNTILTPVLDALPRQAITFTQSSHLDDIFAKISNAIKERSLEVDAGALNEIKKAIKAKHEEKKVEKLELPHGWQTVMRRLVEGLNEDQVFPVLDILRLLILDEDAGQSYVGPHSDTLLIEILHRFGGSHASFDTLPKSVMIMTLRLACNHFAHKSSTTHILSLQYTLPPYGTPNRSILTALLIPSLLSPLPQVKILAASLAYNITLEEASQRRTSSGVQGSMEDLGIHEEWICELVAAIAKALEDVTDDQHEMVLRLVGSLGWSLRYSTEGVRQLAAALSVGDTIKKVKEVFKDKGLTGQRIASVCEEVHHLCRV